MRFERKYRIQHMSVSVVEQFVRLHPSAFTTLYPDRTINNIYLDDHSRSAFGHNVQGWNQRKKIRVRWYGNNMDLAQDPYVEIKQKHNELGAKKRISLDDFSLEDLRQLTAQLSAVDTIEQGLSPSLYNRYRRSYYISFDQKYRITLDREMKYYRMQERVPASWLEHRDPSIVMELKYEAIHDDGIDGITQHFPFRQNKHSKYTTGMLLIEGRI